MEKHILLIYRSFFVIFVFFSVIIVKAEEKTDSLINVATEYTFEGIELFNQKQYKKAEAMFFNSIEIWEKSEIYNGLRAYPQFQLAVMYRLLGDYEKCIFYYNDAEKILLKCSEEYTYILGGLYSNIGFFYLGYGDYQKSLNYYKRSIQILDPIKEENMASYATARFGVAQVYYFQNKFLLSLEEANQYLKLYTINSPFFRQLIGNVYIQIDRIEDAIKVLRSVVNKYYEENDPKYSEATLILAKAYIKNDELEKAEQCFKSVLPILKTEKSERDPWMVYYYEIYGQLLMAKASKAGCNYDKLASYTEAIDVFDKALLLNSHSVDGSIPYLEGKGEFITPTQVKDVFINRYYALKEIASIYKSQKDLFTARNFLDRALKTSEATIEYLHDLRISFLDEESKLSLTEQHEAVYLEAFSTAQELYEETKLPGYLEQMLRISESGKSATFLASLNDVKAKNFGGIPDSLIQKERNIRMQLSSLKQLVFNEHNNDNPDSVLIVDWDQSIFNLQNEHDELIFLFEREYPDFYDFKYNNTTISTTDITKKLKRDQALVEYVVDEPTSPQDSGFVYSIVFESTGVSYHREPVGYDYIVDLQNVISELTNRNIGDSNSENFSRYSKSACDLYNKLIKPLGLSEKTTDLILVPDGRLSYLPFDALLSECPKSEVFDYRKLKYLVYDYNITYSYSATLHFEYFKSSKRKGQDILAFAPEYKDYEFDLHKAAYRNRQVSRALLRPLPGAQDEVRGLSEFQKCKAFLGDDANEKNFKQLASQYDILHLAMHTIINDSIPMFSKLVFAQPHDTLEDGYLNTQEIYNLKLDARLAVLSACNTGSGQMRTGEGVMSLSRAFLFAGCPSIVMTLWEVEDRSSANLMLNFYRYLFKGYSKPEALRKAKLDHIRTADPLKAHPYFWLGYIFVGDPSPIKFNTNVLLSILFFSATLILLLHFLRKFIRDRKKAQN